MLPAPKARNAKAWGNAPGREPRLYSVSVDGGAAEALPMPEAGSGDFSPDSSKIVYSPQNRDFRPEKRYGGGQANALYIFDLKTYDTKRITEGPRATRAVVFKQRQHSQDFLQSKTSCVDGKQPKRFSARSGGMTLARPPKAGIEEVCFGFASQQRRLTIQPSLTRRGL